MPKRWNPASAWRYPRSKYGAQPETVDGVRFASRKEARRYGDLRVLAKAGLIRDLQLQPEFPLAVADTRGILQVIGIYRADFSYVDRESDRFVVEDVKGFKTTLYRWKKKHVEVQYGITVREV